MNNNGKYVTHTLYRYVGSVIKEIEIESFEEELCDFKTAGYDVEGVTMAEGYLLAVLTKKLSDVTEPKKEVKP